MFANKMRWGSALKKTKIKLKANSFIPFLIKNKTIVLFVPFELLTIHL